MADICVLVEMGIMVLSTLKQRTLLILSTIVRICLTMVVKHIVSRQN